MVKFSGIGSVMETEDELSTSFLDLFKREAVEKDLERGYQSVYHPSSMGNEGPYIFYIPPEGESYLDTSTLRLSGKMTIKKPDPNSAGRWVNLDPITTEDVPVPGDTTGKTMKKKTGDLVGFTNFAPYALFRTAEVSLNGELVSFMSTACFPYKAYLENLFSYDRNVKHLDASLRLMDKPGRFDRWSWDDPLDGKLLRSAWTAGSKSVDFSIPLMVDALNLDRLLPNNVEVGIKLSRGSDAFVLQSPKSIADGGLTYKVEIEDLFLTVQRVVPTPEVLRAHAKRFGEGKRAQFPLTRSDIQTRQVPEGSSYVKIPNVFKGRLPNTLILGLVNSNAFHGDQRLNPFNFHHHKVSEVAVRVNSRLVPALPYKMDFENDMARRAYRGLFDSLGVNVDSAPSFVTYDEYLSGYTFYGFSLCPDQCGGHFHHKHGEHGSVDAEIQFASPTQGPLTAVLYASYNDMMELDNLGKAHLASQADF